jgi:protein O-GlcNAc transferase
MAVNSSVEIRDAWIADPSHKQRLVELVQSALTQRNRGIAHAATEFAKSVGADVRDVENYLMSLKPSIDAGRLAFGHVEVADWWLNVGAIDQSIWHLKSARQINPRSKSSFARLFNIYSLQSRFDLAIQIARETLEALPDFDDARVLLAGVLCASGERVQGIAMLRDIVCRNAGNLQAHSRLIFELNHEPHVTAGEKFEAAKEYGRAALRATYAPLANGLRRKSIHANGLRIGFLSSDLHQHPVGYFFEPLLERLSAYSPRTFVYHTAMYEDELTRRLRGHADHWMNVSAADDAALASRIAEDEIDVLVDLSGHAPLNRLSVFARKPAPVQVSWLGYFATTGLTAVDAVLVDRASVNDNEQKYFTEQLVYLGGTRLCFSSPDEAVSIASLPALRNGVLTYGTFQTLGKINDDVLATWLRVLKINAVSRMRFQCNAFWDPIAKANFVKRLADLGWPLERTEFVNSSTRASYLAAHAEVDVILDTFPYQGGTTTCEALWMGVPTITLRGTDMPSRQGASLLTAAGLFEWIANDVDGYVDIAVRCAEDVARLSDIRTSLRERVRASSLMDADQFTQDWFNAISGLWSKFSESRTSD